MKIFIFIFIVTHSFSKAINGSYELDIIYLEKYGTTNTTSENGGICVDINNLDIDTSSYLDLSSKDGTINETLKYEFLYADCYINYTFNIENNSLISIKPDSSSYYNNEFTLEYEFKKKSNSSYLFVVYTNYTGTRLHIAHIPSKSTTTILIILGILGGFAIFLIILCFCCYKCCKVKKKKIQKQYQESILGPII